MAKSANSKLFLKLFGSSSSIFANKGWTLIEVGAVVIVIGILSSLAFPSFGKMQARNQLRGAMGQVQAAFQEAQKNAIKKGSSCTVVITPSTRNVAQASGNNGCVPNPVTIAANSGISFTLPAAATSIQFSYKGNPGITTDQTIVLSHEITSLEPRCLVISSGIGIMRSGYVQGGACTPAP